MDKMMLADPRRIGDFPGDSARSLRAPPVPQRRAGIGRGAMAPAWPTHSSGKLPCAVQMVGPTGRDLPFL